ncbi:MAG TPA: hypothetical protein DIT64_18495 [Verrucomicrobiales bacterium]|nr:hypothetical protein [Verrucomicrobiales bacterium]
MKFENSSRRTSLGFSLIELLTAIAILGLIAGIGIPVFGGNADHARHARDQRNAQTISSLYVTAQAAGVDFSTDIQEVAAIVSRLEQGVTVGKGILKGRTYMLPNLGTEGFSGAVQFLKLENGMLVYQANGAAVAGEHRAGLAE